MTQWEYASLMSDGPATRETLNKMGDDGWELTAMQQGLQTMQLLYVFKRPKPVPPPTTTIGI
jgi:hypothetical protein